MLSFFHYPLCPLSRSVRLLLGESGVDVKLIDEVPWEWRADFLQINPSGELPVLQVQDGPVLCGAYAISEYLDDTRLGASEAPNQFMPFPGNGRERAEVRRLVDWFHRKFHLEVSAHIFGEKVEKRFTEAGDRNPDMAVLRAGIENLDYHMRYIDYLAKERSWLGGNSLSYADFAAAGHISFIDYLGDLDWEDYTYAKDWYARLKSRPCFRSLLGETVPWLKPPAYYSDPDF